MSGVMLSDGQRLDWLRLIRTERIGPRTFLALLRRFGGASAALEALPDLVRASGGRPPKITGRAEAEREIEETAQLGARFVAMGEPDYPKPLRAIDTAPPLIILRGGAEALARPTVAIVGSRNASSAGLSFAARLARELGEAEIVVVSGLARGIDARAHKAALATGTVAVLAGGHDRVYPAENGALLEEILDHGGAVVSEMPLGWEPRGRDFPRRNRIVSGLSYGVIIVEAARRSGSLITARFALEQGREVFAVPGSPVDPRAEGTNDLIRNGATLCAASEHVISVITPLLARKHQPVMLAREPGSLGRAQSDLWDELAPDSFDPASQDDSNPAEFDAFASDEGDETARLSDGQRIIQLLGPTSVTIDDLARQAELPIRVVQHVLTELELTGRIERRTGGGIALLPL